MTLSDLTLLAFDVALLPVIFFSLLFFLLAWINLLVDKPEKPSAEHAFRPFVTVQIPSFNDPIAAQCVEACLAFDYPRDKYEIMILDDSTDPKTQEVLKACAAGHPGFIRYIRRDSRRGYKAGALQEAMPLVRGEIVAIFDADFVPQKEFLKRIVEPFQDAKVAIVQGRQGFTNKDTNLISRFAAYLLMAHHTVIMPINNKINTVFFCGTGGAIRKSAIDAVGGWNRDSIAEDTDLSVRIFSRGYKSVYVPLETPGEVPVTLKGFLKQQMRWCYGNERVWINNARTILFRKGLTRRQRLMISLPTIGNLVPPVVVLLSFFGLAGWSRGDPQLLAFREIGISLIGSFYSAGFLLMVIITLSKRKSLKELPLLLLTASSIGLVLASAAAIASFKAIFMKNRPLFPRRNDSWICTQKQGNRKYR